MTAQIMHDTKVSVIQREIEDLKVIKRESDAKQDEWHYAKNGKFFSRRGKIHAIGTVIATVLSIPVAIITTDGIGDLFVIPLMIFGIAFMVMGAILTAGDDFHGDDFADYNLASKRRELIEAYLDVKIQNGYVNYSDSWFEMTLEYDDVFKKQFVKIVENNGAEIVEVKDFVESV